ncbi:uncharacterized protein CDV56_101552 [Aspergillus thermomutatus]|uniref:Uncharacterized protein n=1 Tax=Aspergillus thermomutatus TaxID=41047 RepID=A0A397G696_ASPTH|nr:uncharacterized protein CDV56_101552 [Aspergillus thermomutatus]RHZ46561.1 hypothetical protein CDV56_101552 [Aspergillus thermomutatus]
MKFLDLLSLSFLLAVASAAAVPDVEGTTTNDAASTLNNINDKLDHCGQLCFNNQECSGKCSKCDKNASLNRICRLPARELQAINQPHTLGSPRAVTVSPYDSSRRLFRPPPLFSSLRDRILIRRTSTRRAVRPRRSYTMPALIESPEPVAPVLRVRELEDDEEYVMTAFERHASHCSQCADPLRVHQEDRTLCDRGRQYAIDVAEYLYSENGKAKSVIDRELSQPTLVKIPRDCVAVRGLLLAIEDGLRLQRKEQEKAQSQTRVAAPIISYDRTYPIAPRRANTQQPIAVNEIIEREPRALKSRRVIIYPSPRGSPSRGSLYDSDAADRIERFKESSSRIYRPTGYYR